MMSTAFSGPQSGSLKGQFLMAMPGLADPHFAQTVTCICEHATEGAVGVIVNRTHEYLAARDIFDELNLRHTSKAGAMPIHLGGPVHTREIFILHGPPFDWDGCLVVTPRLAMSNTMDILKAIAGGDGPASAIIVIGCAGWGPGQLEGELRENAWLTGPIAEEIIFSAPVADRWHQALRLIGIEPSLLSEQAGHA